MKEEGSNRWGTGVENHEDSGAIQLRRQPLSRLRWEIRVSLTTLLEAWQRGGQNQFRALWYVGEDLSSQVQEALATPWGRTVWAAFWIWTLWLCWR